ncbi:regulatory protein TetR [Granulicella mallensis MP5ACTX8]|uniref:Regulatory protein TetR n=1 Tax=Granulicella mallensis (strain ATCC BAA-1857 / DSM 23137 / MP5ACTX8) TaxID=682795 RepID=G8NP35_GRAMM|nr:regulatory protein TetR [Granulicella mallensis MP5ACTX8]
MKIWKDDDPKASLMERKRALIVQAAREAFLTGGYADTSMDSIAKSAGVSIKTVYRHFENKDDLFIAVMQAACSVETHEKPRDWPTKAPQTGIYLAAVEYLRHALSAEQLALYRVVLRDAGRFPELGKRYSAEVIEGRNALFVEYLNRWSPSQGWKIKDVLGAANAFAGLLRSGWFESVLLGTAAIEEKALLRHAKTGAVLILILIESRKL